MVFLENAFPGHQVAEIYVVRVYRFETKLCGKIGDYLLITEEVVGLLWSKVTRRLVVGIPRFDPARESLDGLFPAFFQRVCAGS